MSRLLKGRSKKVGLPPGSLVHIGDKKAAEAKVTVIDYDEAKVQERELKKIEEVYQYRDMPTVTWINVDGLHQVEILAELGKCFGLHQLVVEDILNTDHRPKVEDYGGYIYMVLKMLYYDASNDEVISEQVSLVLGSNFVLSFQEEKRGDVFDLIRERIRTDGSQIRKMGADYLAYSLMDAVVDNYFIVLEKLGERIDDIEEELVTDPASQTLQVIHELKRELLFLRKSVWPLREVVSNLERVESTLIKKATAVYLRDVYDHIVQVIDTVETFRDTVSGMLDIYLSSVSNRLNAVMKVLTIIATIFMPLTFIAGVYGMNFKFMPELEWHWGYPAVLLVMFAVGISMLVYFFKKKWL